MLLIVPLLVAHALGMRNSKPSDEMRRTKAISSDSVPITEV